MNAKEFQEKFITEDGEVNLPGTSCVDVGDEIAEGRYVSNSNVYKHEGQFFEIMWTRSNTGYWGDSESDPPEVVEVEPHSMTVTKYLVKKEQQPSAN